MNNIIPLNYNNTPVTFNESGWFNATEVAEQFGKRPVDWLSLDSTKDYIKALSEILKCEKSSLLKSRRGNSGGTWLHPDLAVPFARWLDMRFSIWCDQQIKSILSGTHQHHDRQRMRHEAASSFKVMNQILKMTRERLGKTSSPHTFSNEARLINYALTGAFVKVDREALSANDLNLLAKLEQLDTVLIGCGLTYDKRKAELECFANDNRTGKQLEVA
jgi:hypothetical protein